MAGRGSGVPENAQIPPRYRQHKGMLKKRAGLSNHLDGKVISIVQLGQRRRESTISRPMTICIVRNEARIRPARLTTMWLAGMPPFYRIHP
jgi:hypothetical protein